MYPVIHLFGIKLYPYGMMMGLGIVLAVTFFLKRCKAEGYNEDSAFNMAIICCISGLLGAKLLFILTELPDFIKDPMSFVKNIGDGFVLYGAVIGGILAGYIYTRMKKWPFIKMLDMAVPLIAMAQGLGRIGCLFSGCCYGKETSAPWGLKFTNSPFAPNDVKLIPTQPISSLGNFIIFGILLWFDSRKKTRDGQTGALYLMLYSVGRFVIEFFRGDPRGTVFNVLSTSQFICIFVFAAGALLMCFSSIRREPNLAEEETSELDEKNGVLISEDGSVPEEEAVAGDDAKIGE